MPNSISQSNSAAIQFSGSDNSQEASKSALNTITKENPEGQHISVQTNSSQILGADFIASPVSAMVVPTVLFLLILFSVTSWVILLIKGIQFNRFERRNKQFSLYFWKSKNLTEAHDIAINKQGAMAHLASIGIDVLRGKDLKTSKYSLAHKINMGERLERALQREINSQRRTLDKGLAILASIGSTAPFIGLFGTVWGIMEALIRIGATGDAGISSVAGPIGHALIATGIGIAAAVPAVLIYNYFIRKYKLATGDMESFAEELYSLAQETSFRHDEHINENS